MEHYLKEAIKIRKSRRVFQSLPLRKHDSDELSRWIGRFNNESQLKMTLVEIDENLFSGFLAKRGVFKGILNYIAIVGDADAPDLEAKAGYYGELMVLEAARLGLSTCWLGSSYKKQRVHETLALGENERLVCIIAVGYGTEKRTVSEALFSKAVKFRSKKLEDMLKFEGACPPWVLDGMSLVMLAPSSSNSQPVVFTYGGGKVTASAEKGKVFKNIDLGIALVHFEIGAAVGRWYKDGEMWAFGRFEQITEN